MAVLYITFKDGSATSCWAPGVWKLMSEITVPIRSKLRPFMITGIGFLVGVAVTIGGIWLSIRYFVSWAAQSDISASENAERRLFDAAAELSKAKDEYHRWLALDDVGMWNVDAGSLDRAKDFAEELLATAERYKNDWNYGNAIHKGHLILGRIELRRGDRHAAAKHLLEAGNTPGSPQLNSFGPNMILAKELLEAGEQKAVLQYLELCGGFWKSDFGALEKWKEMISGGKFPNFGANLWCESIVLSSWRLTVGSRPIVESDG